MSFARYDVNLLLVAVTALSAALAFVAALHLYARCYLRPRRNTSDLFPSTLVEEYPPPHEFTYQVHAAANGLDAKALRALPVFRWESSKSTSQAAAAEPAVRCAVCLGHMVDGELGRLLPACRHVFHVECIDMWLHSHRTCPVCRCNLSPPRKVPGKAAVTAAPAAETTVETEPPADDAVSPV